MLNRKTILAAAIAGACLTPICAEAHPGPRIWLGIDAGRVVTYKQVGTQYEPSQLFSQPLEEIIPGLWTTDFPGYEVQPDGNVPVNTIFGIKLAGPLLRFNPLTNSLQEMIQSGQPRMGITDDSDTTIITSTGVLPGYNFFGYTAPGDHAHLFYTLYGDGQSPGGGLDGVYVLPLQLTSPTSATSKWYFLTLPRNASANDILSTQEITQQMSNAIPGDANFDGQVNLIDFNILAGNFGIPGRWWAKGDFNFDGEVNLTDFNILAGNFGSSAAPALVPEPSTLLTLGALLVLLRRRRC